MSQVLVIVIVLASLVLVLVLVLVGLVLVLVLVLACPVLINITGFRVKVKVCTLDIAPVRETPPQKRSGMARVLRGSHSFNSFTCTQSERVGFYRMFV